MPKAILHWDGKMELMKWRIAARKLQFLRKTMQREYEVLCKQALKNEFLLNLRGLGHEGAVLAREAGLQDQRFCPSTKGVIKSATSKASQSDKKITMEASKKVGVSVRRVGTIQIHEDFVSAKCQSVD